jgi:hypothetical protein
LPKCSLRRECFKKSNGTLNLSCASSRTGAPFGRRLRRDLAQDRSWLVEPFPGQSDLVVLGDCNFQFWRDATKHYSAWWRSAFVGLSLKFGSGSEQTKQRSPIIMLTMATDRWTEQLRCPQCDKTAMVDLSQNDSDETPTVQSISNRFKAVATEYGPHFWCERCNVEVVP